ncbi:MAG: hypothetical protein U0175_18875 [Caldilineaceae bacterium]
MKGKFARVLGGLGMLLLVLLLSYVAMRPLHLHWGATGEDIARSMPGDLTGARWTRSIVIKATPDQIWPWLVQFGQGRGGWYSYDWLENLLGFDIHSADHILAEYQNPQIGDPICMAASVCTSFVSVIEAQQWFGWQAKDDAGKPVWTFMFGLIPMDKTQTKLVVRESFDPSAMPAIATFVLEIPDVVMEQKMLSTLKQRAEGQTAWSFTTPYEITVWLVTFVIGIIASVLFIKRSDWNKPLAVGVAAMVGLMALTFLFPPLWLRGILTIFLATCLVWVWRHHGSTVIQSNTL